MTTTRRRCGRLMHLLTAIITGVVLLQAAAFAEPSSNSFVVKNVRLFDGERVIANATVVVRAGRIVDVGADAATQPPEDLPVIDGRGKTLLPGFIDSHVHVFPGAQEDALRFGVTTELDMFSLGGAESAHAFRRQRESLERTVAADTWSTLNGVTPPGGHPSQLVEQMGARMLTLAADADTKAFIDARIAEGADFIKIFQDDTVVRGAPLKKFSSAQLREVIEAVHANGRKAVVHASAQAEARLAFEMGADMIVHIFEDEPADDDIVRLARTGNVSIIATLSVLASVAGRDDAAKLSADPYIEPWLSPMQTMMLARKVPAPKPERFANGFENVRRFRAAGVQVLAGTDAPNPGTAHGPSIHQEMALLVQAGLSPTAALTAATAAPARAFGLTDRGRIEAGMRADLVLVDGDPTTDITHTRRIAAIWKNGYPVDRTPPRAPEAPAG